MNTEKDYWDKADIVGKIISAVILGILSYVLARGANKIQESNDRVAAALRKGELVQSLVSDLTQSDNSVRKDIALIALNRSVSPEDSQLVIEIVEHVFRNSNLKPQDSLEQNIAFRIIKERSPHKAFLIRKSLINDVSKDSVLRSNLRSQPGIKLQVERVLTPQSQQISTVFPKIVYIQFQGNTKRDLIRGLAANLNKRGYPAPGVERVEGNYTNNVKYFHEEDKELATLVEKEVIKYFLAKGCQANFKLSNHSSSKFKAQKGQIEVWINMDCK